MDNNQAYQKIVETGEYIKSKLNETPEIGIVLGSGLGPLADQLIDSIVIDYSDIPNFPVSTVVGHEGKLVIGKLEGKTIICMKGRFHYYEGYSLTEVTLPIRIMSYIGVKNLILTNASGGVNLDYKPGDLMIIKDHLNFPCVNPLLGKNIEEMGTRFPSASDIYTKTVRENAKKIAKDIDIDVQEGVYNYCTGPSYETPAEIKAYRILGADAVGMSTVPEALVACHCGMKVLGISCITNMAAGILDQPLSHKEVFDTAEKTKDKFSNLIKAYIREIKWN
ncbi:MAG: purine-nucleoside phosphorylase [Ignavibacteriales bacterium]